MKYFFSNKQLLQSPDSNLPLTLSLFVKKKIFCFIFLSIQEHFRYYVFFIFILPLFILVRCIAENPECSYRQVCVFVTKQPKLKQNKVINTKEINVNQHTPKERTFDKKKKKVKRGKLCERKLFAIIVVRSFCFL